MEKENSSIGLVGKYKNIIVIRSASKFFGLPNHRIGYLFANKEIINIYDEISIPFPFSDLSANIFRNAIKDYNKIENYTNIEEEIEKWGFLKTDDIIKSQ